MSIAVPSRSLIVLKSRHFKAKKDRPLEVDQLKLEMVLGMRRELRELEESIAIALSKGASVKQGIHKAELVPERRSGRDGCLRMKLIIALFLLIVLAPAFARHRLFEDLNGDGQIDVAEAVLGLSLAGAATSAEKEVHQNA